MCTGHLSNSVCYLHRNHPELHRPSEPGTLRNLISYLHHNPPEPHQPSAPEPSGTSSNLISHLRQNPPKPHQPSAQEGSGILRNLLRNLVLQLHRIAPELLWAKDPIASFAVGEKKLLIYLLSIYVSIVYLLIIYFFCCDCEHASSCVNSSTDVPVLLQHLHSAPRMSCLCLLAKELNGVRCAMTDLTEPAQPTSATL